MSFAGSTSGSSTSTSDVNYPQETEGACDMNQEFQSESGSYNVSPVCTIDHKARWFPISS
jgi:hypothetical protein